ncbi:hypothetical protein [Anaerosporobacter sp.]|nr:hypothetical protein [Anaerosporobacter sp.]
MHFTKYTVFEQADVKEKIKNIKSWVPVSVAAELECVDMLKAITLVKS